MNTTILFRKSLADEDEFNSAQEYFNVIERRSSIPVNSLIIPRYSSLPYYDELNEDVRHQMSELINSPEQHRYVANISNWYGDLKELTPKSYFQGQFGNIPEGSYVIKGDTNSRKHEWNRRMFAKTRADIPAVVSSLLDDTLIKDQGLVVREFEEFQTYMYGINELPITHEYRVFVCDGQIIAFGYYWASYPEIYEDPGFVNMIDGRGIDLVGEIIETIGNKCRFYVIDIARKDDGSWRLIELNDATMSGLSTIPARSFYANLSAILG